MKNAPKMTPEYLLSLMKANGNSKSAPETPSEDPDARKPNSEFRSLMLELGWSPKELASYLGITKQAVWNWRGQPPEYVLLLLREGVAQVRMAKETLDRWRSSEDR